MTKNSKRKLLLMTVFLSVLLSCSTYAPLIPNAHALELTTQQKGLAILNDVVGLDVTKYSVTTKEIQAVQQAAYLGVIPKEDVEYELTSSKSRLKALDTFTNGKLQMMRMFETEGPQSLTKPAASANAVEMAKDFLNNYQAYTADSLYGELESTLVNVDASKNTTKTSGNTELEICSADGYATFKWTYEFGGVKAPSKFVALGFNNSFLTYFVDNWQLYKIGSKSVYLSKNEAVAIALKTAKAHSWSLKLENDALDARNFNESNVRWTALIFDSSVGAVKPRSEDVLELYPVWRVGVALDKWYGQLYGLEVDIWADTKEVRYVQEAWSTLPPPEGIPTADMSPVAASANPIWIALPTIAFTMTGTSFVWLARKKNSRYYKFLKSRSPKAAVILLCTLILSMALSCAIAPVNATQAGARVWGSESTGAIDPSTGQSWRKHQNEILLQRNTASDIAYYFAQAGYDAVNHQGNYGSWKSQILTDISALNYYYDYAAVVDFDHGVYRYDYAAAPGELHYMFEDNVGTITGPPNDPKEHPENAVYDMDVYTRISSGKINFAFINTCLSANISIQGTGTYGAVGMPYAWTHRLVGLEMSSDGYNSPDSGSQCYIGFPWGAASLMQRVPYDYGTFYRDWVEYFFYYALMTDRSVHDALDQASLTFWGCPFGHENCPLSHGFTCYWWNMEKETWTGCTMAVYGNSSIHLRILPAPNHHWLTISAAEWNVWDPCPLISNVRVDGQWVGTAPVSVWVEDGWHTVEVDQYAWNIYYQCYDSFWWFYPGYSNPEYIQVSVDTWTTAYYLRPF